ncbi:MAG: calcium/sodium antiporter [Planctomycetota bacterium]|jgi:cation:H+ antiporter
MDYLLSSAAVAGGIVLLFLGGDRLVAHAAHFATAHRVPKTVVGAVIIGFGTSLPELVVSLDAAMRGSPQIAIGNVVGSNIANIGLILGLGALLVTFRMQRRVIRWDLPFGVLAILLLMIVVGQSGEVSKLDGLVLLGAFVIYLVGSFLFTRKARADESAPEHDGAKRTGRDFLWIALGIVAIGGGAELLVRGAQELARLLEVSELVIGLTMVALGTSLPELAALLAAVRRKEADLALGNIAGSNLFNILFILGTTAVVRPPIPVADEMVQRDFPVAAILSVLAFPIFSRARRVGRWQGFLLLACYAGYIFWVWT